MLFMILNLIFIITLIILYGLKVNVQDLNMHLITHPQTFFPHQ